MRANGGYRKSSSSWIVVCTVAGIAFAAWLLLLEVRGSAPSIQEGHQVADRVVEVAAKSEATACHASYVGIGDGDASERMTDEAFSPAGQSPQSTDGPTGDHRSDDALVEDGATEADDATADPLPGDGGGSDEEDARFLNEWVLRGHEDRQWGTVGSRVKLDQLRIVREASMPPSFGPSIEGRPPSIERFFREVRTGFRLEQYADGIPEPGESVPIAARGQLRFTGDVLDENVAADYFGYTEGIAMPIRFHQDGEALYVRRDATDQVRRLYIYAPDSIDLYRASQGRFQVVAGPREAIERWLEHYGYGTEYVDGNNLVPLLAGARAFSWGPKPVRQQPHHVPERDGYRLYELPVRDGDVLATNISSRVLPIASDRLVVSFEELTGDVVDIPVALPQAMRRTLDEWNRVHGASWSLHPQGMHLGYTLDFEQSTDEEWVLRGPEATMSHLLKEVPVWRLMGDLAGYSGLTTTGSNALQFNVALQQDESGRWQVIDGPEVYPRPLAHLANRVSTFVRLQFPLDDETSDVLSNAGGTAQTGSIRVAASPAGVQIRFGRIDRDLRTALVHVVGPNGARCTVTLTLTGRYGHPDEAWEFEVSLPQRQFFGVHSSVPVARLE